MMDARRPPVTLTPFPIAFPVDNLDAARTFYALEFKAFADIGQLFAK
jgi:extradiol dioxygenase family protein